LSFIFNNDGSIGFRLGGSNFYADARTAATLSHPGLAFERKADTANHGVEGVLGSHYLYAQLESDAGFTCFGVG
jgi:hypothetical protein